MSETIFIKAKQPDGEIRDLQLTVSLDSPWTLEYRDADGRAHCYQERDLFETLREMRKELESTGVQLLCAGARTDVWPSGMSRSMAGGRKAYILHIGKQATERVDIFDYAEPKTIGTVQQQLDYFHAWIEALKALVKPIPGEIQEAQHHPNGWVYRIAGDFGPEDGVPPEAIVGAWKVNAQGEIVGNFMRNEKYNPARWPGRRKS